VKPPGCKLARLPRGVNVELIGHSPQAGSGHTDMLYGFGEYDEPPHSGEDDPIARHMSLWPEHRLCAIAPLWPLSDPTHPSTVVRHCSKNPIPGKTGIQTKIQELVLRLLCVFARNVRAHGTCDATAGASVLPSIATAGASVLPVAFRYVL
jgi:hypothetical protein